MQLESILSGPQSLSRLPAHSASCLTTKRTTAGVPTSNFSYSDGYEWADSNPSSWWTGPTLLSGWEVGCALDPVRALRRIENRESNHDLSVLSPENVHRNDWDTLNINDDKIDELVSRVSPNFSLVTCISLFIHTFWHDISQLCSDGSE